MRDDILERMRRLRLMIFDVDGVLTDGTLYFSETGAELKAFNARDGHGLKMLKESGVEVAILSARRSRAVEVRAAELGITLVEQGAGNKGAAFESLIGRLRTSAMIGWICRCSRVAVLRRACPKRPSSCESASTTSRGLPAAKGPPARSAS